MINTKLFLSLLIIAFLTACAPNYSEGTRVGVVTKLSYKGLIWKSWEGSLNQGGTKNSTDSNGNTTVVPNAINFNVQSPEVIKQLQEAMKTGARVEIEYHQWLLHPLSIENDYVVVAVKPAQ